MNDHRHRQQKNRYVEYGSRGFGKLLTDSGEDDWIRLLDYSVQKGHWYVSFNSLNGVTFTKALHY